MLLKRIPREGREGAKNREGDEPRAKRFQKPIWQAPQHDCQNGPAAKHNIVAPLRAFATFAWNPFSKAFETE
jgi:hypothetical protein